jgi:transposase
MIRPLTMEQFREMYVQGIEATYALFVSYHQVIERLEHRIAHLEAILAKDSHNSSKPPSSNGYTRPQRSLRTPSGKKVGGHPGHKGVMLQQVASPDATVIHRPEGMCSCGRSLAAASVISTVKRQVFDLPPITLAVTEHQAQTVACACGTVHRGVFPAGITAPVQYGNGIKAVATYCVVRQLAPVQRTQQLFKDVFGIDVSVASILGSTVSCHAGRATTEKRLQERIVNSAVVHADETGCSVNGALWWIHSLGTNRHTWYCCDRHRGKEAAAVVAMLDRFWGRLIHDGWKAYQRYGCRHGLCNAHHLRELVFIDEQCKESWARSMKQLLLEIKGAVDDARAEGKRSLSDDVPWQYRARYDAIIREGLLAQPPPRERRLGQRGRLAQSPGKNLLDRLSVHRDAVLAYMYDFTVPFTNNLAERDLRMVKVKGKVSGGFRTQDGAHDFCRMSQLQNYWEIID